MSEGLEFTVELAEHPKRKVHPLRIYKKGILLCEACDAPQFEPRLFFIREALDLDRLFDLLPVYWASAHQLSLHLTPKKRLPQEVLEAFFKLNGRDSLVLFEKLADEGYFYPVTPLQRGFLPKGLTWEDVPPLCLR